MYRQPTPPDEPVPESAEYEAQLVRSAKRKRLVFRLVVGLTVAIGAGMLFWSLALSAATSAWNGRRTTPAGENAETYLQSLDRFEYKLKASQDAFDAVWPKVRAGELHAHPELGDCALNPRKDTFDIQGPLPGAGSDRWTFIDLTSTDSLRDSKIRLASADRPPQLVATSKLERVARYRAQLLAGVPKNQHEAFLDELGTFASRWGESEVIVLIDEWREPNVAAGRAFAWDPQTNKIACTAHAFARGSTPAVAALNLERFLLVSFNPAAEGLPKPARDD